MSFFIIWFKVKQQNCRSSRFALPLTHTDWKLKLYKHNTSSDALIRQHSVLWPLTFEMMLLWVSWSAEAGFSFTVCPTHICIELKFGMEEPIPPTHSTPHDWGSRAPLPPSNCIRTVTGERTWSHTGVVLHPLAAASQILCAHYSSLLFIMYLFLFQHVNVATLTLMFSCWRVYFSSCCNTIISININQSALISEIQCCLQVTLITFDPCWHERVQLTWFPQDFHTNFTRKGKCLFS